MCVCYTDNCNSVLSPLGNSGFSDSDYQNLIFKCKSYLGAIS